MIITQERAFLKAQQQLQAMEVFVEQAADDGQRIDQVERELFSRLLAVGHTLLAAFVAAQGDGDAGEQQETPDGRMLHRLKKVHARRYLSIFGELRVRRWVYAEREKQQIERAPLDERLGLPASEFSYVLEDWLQRLCVKESFHEATSSLRDLLGLAPSARAAEQMNQRMAERAEAFGLQLAAPPPDEEAELLVATADGKGVPMRRPLEERVRRSSRHVKGEKANKKQMAYVGAVYTIDRFRRTADEVVEELARKQRAAERPAPQHKQVWAEMTRLAVGDSCTGRERLWQAAQVFHRAGSCQAEQFVQHHLRLLLEGKVGHVIGRLKRLRDEHTLRGSARHTVSAIIGYYQNNRQHMRYDEYLAAGYPIGSGVAEGACRHVVKDRLEQTGMRWTVNGAQAMLHLRAIYLNGHWNNFVNYRIETEQTTLYRKTAA